MNTPIPKPNCFIVGAAKCGTTSIFEWLRQHPDVFMTPFKEPGHFCTDLSNPGWIRERSKYLELFEGAIGQSCIGEASVAYLYSKVAAQEIHSFNPEARILIALRNPVDMLHSLHNFLVYLTKQPVSDFETALSSPVAGNSGYSPEFLDYRMRARFHEQIQRYLDVFPKEQIHIVLFDDLKERPHQTFEGILNFLGLSPAGDIQLEKKNPARTYKNRTFQRFFMNPGNFVRAVTRPLKKFRLYHRFLSLIDSMNSRPARIEPMKPELRRRLLKEFEPDIERLGLLIGRDLSSWTR